MGFRGVEILRAVFEVAGPVGEFVGGRPGREMGDGGGGDCGGGEFDEGALVHGEVEDSFCFEIGVILHPRGRITTWKRVVASICPGKLERNELRPYKVLVDAEGGMGRMVGATKNKNGRDAEAHRPFHIFVKWN